MPTLKRYLNVSEQFFRLYSLNKWLYLCRMEHKLLNFLGIYQSDSMENHAVRTTHKKRSGRSEASTRNDTFCGIRLRHRPFALARTDSTHLLVLYVHRMCVRRCVCIQAILVLPDTRCLCVFYRNNHIVDHLRPLECHCHSSVDGPYFYT